MPLKCSVVKCNHPNKLVNCRLRRFPKDDVWAKKWEDNMHRENWVRKPWARLCECHFEESQFEKTRADGIRKLRFDAVPSIFARHKPSATTIRKQQAEAYYNSAAYLLEQNILTPHLLQNAFGPYGNAETADSSSFFRSLYLNPSSIEEPFVPNFIGEPVENIIVDVNPLHMLAYFEAPEESNTTISAGGVEMSLRKYIADNLAPKKDCNSESFISHPTKNNPLLSGISITAVPGQFNSNAVQHKNSKISKVVSPETEVYKFKHHELEISLANYPPKSSTPNDDFQACSYATSVIKNSSPSASEISAILSASNNRSNENSHSNLIFSYDENGDDQVLDSGENSSTSGVFYNSFNRDLKNIKAKNRMFSRELYSEISLKNKHKPYICKICDKSFATSSYLYIHKRQHTGERPYKCITCGKAFIERANWKKHSLTHTNQRPFRCDECGKSFTRRDILKVHTRIHTEEKRFVCNVCCKAFLRNIDLKTHILLHKGERPFSCTQCDATFLRKSHLSTHIAVHKEQEQFTCEICGAVFDKRQEFNDHVQEKHGASGKVENVRST